jgi:hypothetical protein
MAYQLNGLFFLFRVFVCLAEIEKILPFTYTENVISLHRNRSNENPADILRYDTTLKIQALLKKAGVVSTRIGEPLWKIIYLFIGILKKT